MFIRKKAYWPVSPLAFRQISQECPLTRPPLTHMNSVLMLNQQHLCFSFSASHLSVEILPVSWFRIIEFPTIHFLWLTLQGTIWGSHLGKFKIALCTQSLTISCRCFGCFLTQKYSSECWIGPFPDTKKQVIFLFRHSIIQQLVYSSHHNFTKVPAVI